MTVLEALQSVQYVTVKERRFAVLDAEDWDAGWLSVVAHNNLFHNSSVIISSDVACTLRDNAFDASSVFIDLGTSGNLDHNAYLNGSTNLSDNIQPSDIVTNLAWVTGPLGSYYQPTNSPLIDAGSVTNAALVGLYNYTTTANQVPERNSPVDIGVHYIPYHEDPNDIDGDGLTNDQETQLGTDPYNPDTDMDGVSDYVEYLQGRNPLIPGAVADTNGVLNLQIYTLLK